jgi:hypothetical protein
MEGLMALSKIGKFANRQLAIYALCIIGAACTAGGSSEAHTFLLRTEQVDLQLATTQVRDTLVSELQAGDLLQSPYPVSGYVTTVPDPVDPNIEVMHCRAGLSEEPQDEACLSLNPAGDFIRLVPITWQSAAFYMYKIYVLPRSLLSRVDPAKDFVAIDVFLMDEPDLWDDIAQAIRQSAHRLGAQPFRP